MIGLVEYNGKSYRVADAHAHIYPEKIARKATAAVGEFYDIPMDEVGMSEILIKQERELGIEKCLICSVATKQEQVTSINSFIAENCRQNKEFFGFAAWHQDTADIDKVLNEIQELGLLGIKLHPDFQGFNIDDEQMLDLYREANRRKLPVLFHMGDSRTDYSSPVRLMRVINKIPDFVCIAAHLGGYLQWEEAKKQLRGANVYTDTSSSLAFLSVDDARSSIEHFGVNRTLFGTDFPMWKPKDEIMRFFNLGFGEKDNRCILYDNFAELFVK